MKEFRFNWPVIFSTDKLLIKLESQILKIMPKFLKIVLGIAVVLAILFYGFKTWTKSHSPEDVAEITRGDLNIKVNYCQPAVKGRNIFGDLVPYDKVWRTGANEATVISFSRDVSIEGQSLAAGTYSLWSIPTDSTWSIIFNKETGQWGTMYDESGDVLKVDVPSEKTTDKTELFTISMEANDADGAMMKLKWDQTLVKVRID